MSAELIRAVLREHWLTGTGCDKEAQTNAATCYCSTWRSAPASSPVAAVEAWIEHFLEHLYLAEIDASHVRPGDDRLGALIGGKP